MTPPFFDKYYATLCRIKVVKFTHLRVFTLFGTERFEYQKQVTQVCILPTFQILMNVVMTKIMIALHLRSARTGQAAMNVKLDMASLLTL